ncbi:MAG TPA: hypothetical protein VEL07_13270 [Planctomycetota bacterium]|nr:hypothetical protein [Planctomycetota bacterium]
MRISILIAVLGLVLIGCGQKRRYGDDGGVPTAFTVTLEKAFVSDMQNRQGRVGVGGGVGMGSRGSSAGVGLGLSFSATVVYLLGGEQSGGAQIFRRELSWGENTFTVPLTPGRELALTVQVQGGREGWEGVGSVTIPEQPGAVVDVRLLSTGPSVSVAPPPASAPAAESAR